MHARCPACKTSSETEETRRKTPRLSYHNIRVGQADTAAARPDRAPAERIDRPCGCLRLTAFNESSTRAVIGTGPFFIVY